jgi:hypothetical protein
MTTPVDQLFVGLRKRFEDLEVQRLFVRDRDVDDDNLWYLSRPGLESNVQVESRPGGSLPLILESDVERVEVESVERAAAVLAQWLS